MCLAQSSARRSEERDGRHSLAAARLRAPDGAMVICTETASFDLFGLSLPSGTEGSNPACSAGESVLTCAQPHNWLRTPHLGGGLRVGWDVRGDGPAANRCSSALFLCRALMQSHFGRATPDDLGPRRCRGPAADRC